MKHSAPQFDLPGTSDAFNLITEETEDGALVRKAREQSARIQAEAADLEKQKQGEFSL